MQVKIQYKDIEMLRKSLKCEFPLKILPPIKAKSNHYYFY